jgi:hypothetical protein
MAIACNMPPFPHPPWHAKGIFTRVAAVETLWQHKLGRAFTRVSSTSLNSSCLAPIVCETQNSRKCCIKARILVGQRATLLSVPMGPPHAAGRAPAP